MSQLGKFLCETRLKYMLISNHNSSRNKRDLVMVLMSMASYDKGLIEKRWFENNFEVPIEKFWFKIRISLWGIKIWNILQVNFFIAFQLLLWVLSKFEGKGVNSILEHIPFSRVLPRKFWYKGKNPSTVGFEETYLQTWGFAKICHL